MSDAWGISRHHFVYGVKLIDGSELIAQKHYGPATHQEAVDALPGFAGQGGKPAATHYKIATDDGGAIIPADKVLYHFVRSLT